MTIHSLFPNFYSGEWVSHSFKSIADELIAQRHTLNRYSYSSSKNLSSETNNALPTFGYRCSQLIGKDLQDRLFKSMVLRRIKSQDSIYLWMDDDVEFIAKLRRKGIGVIAKEMINCPMKLRDNLLAQAHASAGINYSGDTSSESANREIEHLQLCDIVFCSNQSVKRALIDLGIDENKCKLVSFGFSPSRLAGGHKLIELDNQYLNPIFTGTLDVRKGAATLLSAWNKANTKGKLIIAGNIDSVIFSRFKHLLNPDKVIQLGHITDVGAAYRSANAFIFPSWEEGGPLVTLEAMSQGLPCLVSPMGTASAFDESDRVGLISDPGDVDALVENIKLLDNNQDLRAELSSNARLRSQEYTWRKAAEKRALFLTATINPQTANPSRVWTS